MRKIAPLIAITFVANFISFGVGINAIAPLFPMISREIPLSPPQMGLIYSVALIAIAICSIPSGTIGDRIGPRRVVMAGLLLVVISCAIRILAYNVGMLMAASFIGGMAVSCIYPHLPKVLSAYVPPERYSTAVAIGSVCGGDLGTSAGLGLAVPLALALTGWGAWRGVFGVVVIVAIILSILWMVSTRGRGAMTSTSSSTSSVSDEVESTREMIIKVLRNSQMWYLCGAQFCIWSAMYSFVSFFPLIGIEFGFSEVLAGWMISSFALIAVPSEFAGGWFSDRIGWRRRIIVVCALLVTLDYIGLSLATEAWIVHALCLFQGVTFGFFYPLPFTMPLEIEGVGTSRASTAEGLLFTIGMCGGFFGPVVSGHILEVTGVGYPFWHYIFCAVMFAIATILYFRMKETGWKARGRSVGLSGRSKV